MSNVATYDRLVRDIKAELKKDPAFRAEVLRDMARSFDDRRAKPRPKKKPQHIQCPVTGCKNPGVKKFGLWCKEHAKLTKAQKAKYKKD